MDSQPNSSFFPKCRKQAAVRTERDREEGPMPKAERRINRRHAGEFPCKTTTSCPEGPSGISRGHGRLGHLLTHRRGLALPGRRERGQRAAAQCERRGDSAATRRQPTGRSPQDGRCIWRARTVPGAALRRREGSLRPVPARARTTPQCHVSEVRSHAVRPAHGLSGRAVPTHRQARTCSGHLYRQGAARRRATAWMAGMPPASFRGPAMT